MDGKALQVHPSPEGFALRKHNLEQAMLAVNEMFYLTVMMMTSLLYEDVGNQFRVGKDALAGWGAERTDDLFLRPDNTVVPSSSPAKTASARPRRSYGVVA